MVKASHTMGNPYGNDQVNATQQLDCAPTGRESNVFILLGITSSEKRIPDLLETLELRRLQASVYKFVNSDGCAPAPIAFSSSLQNDLARFKEGFQVGENTWPATGHGLDEL